MRGARSAKSLVIALHEIYGVNDHLRAFTEALANENYETICPNLLNRDSYSYDQEEIAYSRFMNEIGFDRSLEAVQRVLAENRDRYRRIYAVGFSIGATLAWRCSEYEVDGVIGYYGSRIRDYPEVEPTCPTLLFFADKEKSFDASELAERLGSKRLASVEVVNAEHGFMNPYYDTFDSAKYRECFDRSLRFLKQLDGEC